MSDRLFWSGMTLGQAREKLATLAVEGHTCPCCSQMAKVYRRKVHAGIAAMLIRMYRAGGADEFVYLPSLRKGRDGMDQTLAQHWGLIEEEKARRPDGGRVGWWLLTDLGRAFVLGQASIRKYALVYNGNCLGQVGDPITIINALGTKFDYRELMEGE